MPGPLPSELRSTDRLLNLTDTRHMVHVPKNRPADFEDIQLYLAQRTIIPAEISNLMHMPDLKWYQQQRTRRDPRVYTAHRPSTTDTSLGNADVTLIIDEADQTPTTLSIAGIGYFEDQLRRRRPSGKLKKPADAERVVAARYDLTDEGSLTQFLLSLSFGEEKYVEEIGNNLASPQFWELLGRFPTPRSEPRSTPSYITPAMQRRVNDTEGILINHSGDQYYLGNVPPENPKFENVQKFAGGLGFVLQTTEDHLKLSFTPQNPNGVVVDFKEPPAWEMSFPHQLAD